MAGAPATWPRELAELVTQRSGGALKLAEDSEVGRHLVATRDLAPDEPVLTEWALFAGSDEAPSLRRACKPGDAAGMLEAWERPDGGGSNPLAHFDLFCAFALERAAAAGAAGAPAAPAAAEQAVAAGGGPGRREDAAARLERVDRWFCRPDAGDDVDRGAQTQKLQMLLGALRPELRRLVGLEELRRFDDVLTRNCEELTGAPAVLCGTSAGGRPPCLGRRRFQGIFPCKDLIQHSCQPNCLTVAGPEEPEPGADGGGAAAAALAPRLVMQIVPVRPIKAGEQLSWCYLPYWKQLWPTQLRRQALREGWHFVCRCQRCAGGTAAPERVMAFRCPSPGCGLGEVCPAAPCAAEGDAAAGHVTSLRSVASMVCRSCGLRLERGGGPHEGYLERCLNQEAAAFGLPWRGVFGRDLAAAPAGSLDLLSKDHWLLVDQASHELENAPAILAARGLAAECAGAAAVRAALAGLARAAGAAAAAFARLLGDGARSVALPELLLWKALCTDERADFEACAAAHRASLGGLAGARSTVAAADLLCGGSAEAFVERELARKLAGCGAAAASKRRRDVGAAAAGKQALQQERTRVESWIGAGEGGESWSSGAWALRRMWLCPDFGWTPLEDEEGEEEEEKEEDEEEDGEPDEEEQEAEEEEGNEAANCGAKQGQVEAAADSAIQKAKRCRLS